MSAREEATARTKALGIFGTLPALGAWLEFPSVVAADVMARAGFDFGIVDLEHGMSSYETAMAQILAFDAQKRPTLLRPSMPADPWIKRGLDLGAAGIIAPNVPDVATARAVVAAAHYGPSGARGAAPGIVRAAAYGADDSYLPTWNDRAFVMAQIETPAALSQAGAIAAVDGVDGLFFGPTDFSTAAGFPGATVVGEAFASMVEAARSQGKLVGSVPFAGHDVAELQRLGVDVIIMASDIVMLRKAAEGALAAARAET